MDAPMKNKQAAREMLQKHGVPLDKNFFTLGSFVVSNILDAAKEYGYRQSKNANGSTARTFYEYANR